MKIALLATDNRENNREYHIAEPYFGTAPEALLEGFASEPDIEVHVISCAQQPLRSPEMIAPNIHFSSLHVPKRGWLRTGYQGCIRAVRRRLATIRPDIVHGQGTERDCAISAVLSGFANVVTIHGNMGVLAALFKARPLSFGWLAAQLENWTLPRTSGVFCNSAYTESLVRPRARRVWRVPNALRAAFFAPPVQREPAVRPVILNVGVVSPRKRQVELLESLHRELPAPWPFRLRFIGPVDQKNHYGRRFLELIDSDSIRYSAEHIDSCSCPDLIRQFDSAHGLVHFPTEEAFGLVVAEALARNLQLFSTRLGGITEIVEGVPCALLFDQDDWRGLISAIVRWAGTGGATVAETQALVAARFHPSIVARRHIEIYREVLSTRP